VCAAVKTPVVHGFLDFLAQNSDLSSGLSHSSPDLQRVPWTWKSTAPLLFLGLRESKYISARRTLSSPPTPIRKRQKGVDAIGSFGRKDFLPALLLGQ
jgi:hypothetical protein